MPLPHIATAESSERWLCRAGRIHLQPFDEMLEVWNAKANIPAGGKAQLASPFRDAFAKPHISPGICMAEEQRRRRPSCLGAQRHSSCTVTDAQASREGSAFLRHEHREPDKEGDRERERETT